MVQRSDTAFTVSGKRGLRHRGHRFLKRRSFGLVFNVTKEGKLLALFPARDLDGGVALAYDSADNTLWVTTSVGSVGQDTLLRQFSALKTIDVLGTAHPVLDSLVLGNTRAFGAESVFRSPAAVPEPPMPALLLMAFLVWIALSQRGLRNVGQGFR